MICPFTCTIMATVRSGPLRQYYVRIRALNAGCSLRSYLHLQHFETSRYESYLESSWNYLPLSEGSGSSNQHAHILSNGSRFLVHASAVTE